MQNQFQCEDGKHAGVNNTTGRCPVCGEQIESPSEDGFAKALYLEDPFSSEGASASATTNGEDLYAVITESMEKKSDYLYVGEDAIGMLFRYQVSNPAQEPPKDKDMLSGKFDKVSNVLPEGAKMQIQSLLLSQRFRRYGMDTSATGMEMDVIVITKEGDEDLANEIKKYVTEFVSSAYEDIKILN